MKKIKIMLKSTTLLSISFTFVFMLLGTTTNAADIAAAKALIAQHTILPDFVAPGPAFDARKCMKGKKMFVIPLTMQNPFNAEISKAMKAAADMIGFELKNSENQLRMDQWVQAMAIAISGGYDIIDMQGGTPPTALGPQIQQAHAAGVKVTTTHLYDVTQRIPDNLDGSARMDYTRAGQLMANWAIVETNGKANVIILGSQEIIPAIPQIESIKRELNTNCPECKYIYINVPATEWGTKIQPSIQAALIKDPSINFILSIYDSMNQFVIPALKVTNNIGKVKIATYNGTPFVLDMIRRGEVDMNVGESLGWVGMAGVDANMRILCGLPKVTRLNSPLYIFDKSNIHTVSNPATFNSGYGDVHVAGFRKLWGLE